MSEREEPSADGTRQVSVTLSEEFIEAADRIAAAQHRSRGNLLAVAIYSFFEWKPELDAGSGKKETR